MTIVHDLPVRHERSSRRVEFVGAGERVRLVVSRELGPPSDPRVCRWVEAAQAFLPIPRVALLTHRSFFQECARQLADRLVSLDLYSVRDVVEGPGFAQWYDPMRDAPDLWAQLEEGST